MTFREWLRLLPKEQENDLVHDRLAAKLVDTLYVINSHAHQTIDIEAQTVHLDAPAINIKNRNEMVRLLLEEGRKRAREWCDNGRGQFDGLIGFKPDRNQLIDGRWVVQGTWSFQYKKLQPLEITDDSSELNRGG